ncbi:MAG: YbjQ family protein [Pirellulales bacterium]
MDAASAGSGRQPHPQAMLTANPMCTTALELPGYRIVKNLGVVRGLVVRSRSVVGNFAAGIQSMFGGNITILTTLCEQARADAFDLMIQHANQMGANAIVAVRYDATEIMQGATEVISYGTAVLVEPYDDQA